MEDIMWHLPDQPNLDQLRRQARELHRAAAAGDPDATRRQPPDRFWTFQGIEASIFLGLSLMLLALTTFVVLRHDA
jgi:hypothetical protein